MNKAETAKFKRQVRDYFDYVRGYAYLRWSRKRHLFYIALSKKTYWIRRTQKKK